MSCPAQDRWRKRARWIWDAAGEPGNSEKHGLLQKISSRTHRSLLPRGKDVSSHNVIYPANYGKANSEDNTFLASLPAKRAAKEREFSRASSLEIDGQNIEAHRNILVGN